MKFLSTILTNKVTQTQTNLKVLDNKFLSFNGPLGVNYVSLNDPSFIRSLEYTLFYNQLHKKDIALKKQLAARINSVTTGYFIELLIVGLGFRAKITETGHLMLNLGYSHAFALVIPKGLNLLISKDKILVFGGDILLLGNFVTKVTSLKRLDSYKGKGIRILVKELKLKEGKKQKL